MIAEGIWILRLVNCFLHSVQRLKKIRNLRFCLLHFSSWSFNNDLLLLQLFILKFACKRFFIAWFWIKLKVWMSEYVWNWFFFVNNFWCLFILILLLLFIFRKLLLRVQRNFLILITSVYCFFLRAYVESLSWKFLISTLSSPVIILSVLDSLLRLLLMRIWWIHSLLYNLWIILSWNVEFFLSCFCHMRVLCSWVWNLLWANRWLLLMFV